MHIQAISLEKVEVPSFLARINLREVERDSGKTDCKAVVWDRSCFSGVLMLGLDGTTPLPRDPATGPPQEEIPAPSTVTET